MKNIFKILNQSGAVSKPMITGMITGVSLLATGLGLYSTHSAPKSPAQALNAPSLSARAARYGAEGSLANTYSRQTLDEAVAIDNANRAQAARQAAAAHAQGAATGPGTRAQAAAAQNNDFQNNNLQGNKEAGLIESMAGGGIKAAPGGVQNAQAAAAAKAANQGPAQLQTSSNAGAGSSGGAGSGVTAGTASATPSSINSRASALAESGRISASRAQADDLHASGGMVATGLRGGRTGVMGGSNVGAGRGNSGGGSGQQGIGAMLNLNTASSFSSQGARTSYANVLAGTAQAALSFDGGAEQSGIPGVNPNSSVQQQGLQQATAIASTIGGNNVLKAAGGLDEIQKTLAEETAEKERLLNKVRNKVLGMAGIAVAAALAAQGFANAAYKALPFSMALYWGAIAAAALGIGGMAALMWAGDESIVGCIRKLNDLKHIKNAAGNWGTTAPVLFGVFTAAIGISMIPYSWAKIKSALTKGSKKATEEVAKETVKETGKKTLGSYMKDSIADTMKDEIINEAKNIIKPKE